MFKRQTQIVNTGYGANNVTYLPDTTNPLFNAFGRGGILPTFHWEVLQGAQMWVNPALRVIGNPGVLSAQWALQPLIDTRGINGT